MFNPPEESGRQWVEPGHVYLVGTPIGNLADFSSRAVAVLQQVDRILCEDTRETEMLCRQFGIRRPLVSFHAHNAAQRLPQVGQWIADGESLAMVSDRGMPAVSDPGQELVGWLYQSGVPFSIIPGVSAQVTAFAASGYPHPYAFWGFLPPSGKARRERWEAIAQWPFTGVIYEAPHHMEKLLAELCRLVGDERELMVGRELTKKFEEYWRGTARLLHEQKRVWRGEIVLVLAPPAPSSAPVPWEALLAEVDRRVSAGATKKEAIQQIASEFHVSRRTLYNMAQKQQRD